MISRYKCTPFSLMYYSCSEWLHSIEIKVFENKVVCLKARIYILNDVYVFEVFNKLIGIGNSIKKITVIVIKDNHWKLSIKVSNTLTAIPKSVIY